MHSFVENIAEEGGEVSGDLGVIGSAALAAAVAPSPTKMLIAHVFNKLEQQIVYKRHCTHSFFVN